MSRLTRRDLLVAGGATTAVAVAGCTRASEFLTDQYTGDLNLFNTSDGRVTGSLELHGPDGLLLAEQFDIPPDDNPDDREPTAIYEDLLSTAGEHRFTITADAEDRQDSLSKRFDTTAPEDEQIVVFLGERLTEAFLTVRVVEGFAELESEFENF